MSIFKVYQKFLNYLHICLESLFGLEGNFTLPALFSNYLMIIIQFDFYHLLKTMFFHLQHLNENSNYPNHLSVNYFFEFLIRYC
jgi:hypothetical protein